jgi:hypothetical protein
MHTILPHDRTGEGSRILLLLGCVMFLSAGALAALSIDLAPLLGATLINHGT